MKKYSIFMAVAALMFAVSCNKEEVNTVEPTVETELITVDLNPMTKTSLDGKATVWTEGDEVSVTVGGKNIGSLKLVKGTTSTFSGEVEAGKTGAATLNYPAGVTSVPTTQAAVAGSFANGAALLEGETTMEALRACEGAQLSNTTALLQFKTSINGDVAFTIGNKTYTVTGCEASNTYYACVDPKTTGKLSYTVASIFGANEKSNFEPSENKVYNLGILDLKTSNWAVVGSPVNFGSWTPENSKYKFYESDNFYVAKNVPFSSSDNFKLVNNGTWRSVSSLAVGTWMKLIDGGNMKGLDGTYDIYILKSGSLVYITQSGSATPTYNGCKLIVKVNTKYNWWNKYIYTWDSNGTQISCGWPGTVLTWIEQVENYYVYYYEFPPEYNNKTINYHVNGGNDSSKTYDSTVKLVSPTTTIQID